MGLPTPIAFLGLGIMGSGMAGRLLEAGYPLTVYNRSAERAEPLRQRGARVAATPREAAGGAAIVISMVSNDSASEAMWTGTDGALAGAAASALLIECSTLSVGWVRSLATTAAQRGHQFLDAPVTGTKPHAAAGQLVFLVGGDATALEKARPVFMAMGRDVTHLGPQCSGALVKLINNFVCGTQLIAIAEALAMIERSGLDVAKAISVLTDGAPGSPYVKTMVQRMTAKDYTPNFMLRLLAKDVTYAIAEARQHSLELTSAKGALAELNRAISAGLGDRDMSSVIELLRR